MSLAAMFLSFLVALGLIRLQVPALPKSTLVTAVRAVVATPTPPTPTSTPTSAPTPTPEQLSGFCERVPILMYHHTETTSKVKADGHARLNVTIDWFDRQMSYLKMRGYNFLTMSQVADALINKKHLGGKPVVITMDDGYDDIYQNAFPVIEKYGVAVDLEIPTGLIGNSGYLTWDQLGQMQNSGLVHIYNHTWSHANLATTPTKITYEVTTADRQLQDNLGISPKIVTYPYGSYNNLTIKTLKGLGFIAGLSTKPGQMQCDSFVMSLHRTRIGNAPLTAYGL